MKKSVKTLPRFLNYLAEHSTEYLIMAFIVGAIGLFITFVQERIFHLPYRFSDQFWLSNCIVMVMSYLSGRGLKKSKEGDDENQA